MFNSEFSADNVQLHHCEVRRVFPSGLLDVKSRRGPSFERVAPLASKSSFTVGTQCMLLTDGAQKIVLGPFREPDNGTIHERTEDFVDWNEAEMLHVEDRYGTRATVVAAKGIGVWVETGDFCSTHWSPATNQIAQFCERLDVYMPAYRQEIWHDGNRAGARYRWRTRPDDAMLDGELQGDVEAGGGRGLELNIRIEEKDDALEVVLDDNGEERVRVTYNRDKTLTVVCDEIVTDGKRVAIAAEDSLEVETKLFEVASDDVRMGKDSLDDVAMSKETNDGLQSLHSRLQTLEQQFAGHVHGFAGPAGLTSPPPPSPPGGVIDPDTFDPDSLETLEPPSVTAPEEVNSSNLKAKK